MIGLVKILKGLSAGALRFVVIGIGIPLALDYASPLLSTYVSLPPSSARWTAFILFGALFAVVAFLQNGYSKGDYPWLFGKLGGGPVNVGFYYYIFQLLPSSLSSLGSAGVQASGLLLLIYLAIALSYGYLVFDFIDARRKNRQKKGEE
jgi:hypothetical protein